MLTSEPSIVTGNHEGCALIREELSFKRAETIQPMWHIPQASTGMIPSGRYVFVSGTTSRKTVPRMLLEQVVVGCIQV